MTAVTVNVPATHQPVPRGAFWLAGVAAALLRGGAKAIDALFPVVERPVTQRDVEAVLRTASRLERRQPSLAADLRAAACRDL